MLVYLPREFFTPQQFRLINTLNMPADFKDTLFTYLNQELHYDLGKKGRTEAAVDELLAVGDETYLFTYYLFLEINILAETEIYKLIDQWMRVTYNKAKKNVPLLEEYQYKIISNALKFEHNRM